MNVRLEWQYNTMVHNLLNGKNNSKMVMLPLVLPWYDLIDGMYYIVIHVYET